MLLHLCCQNAKKKKRNAKEEREIQQRNAKNKDVPVLNHLPPICLSCLSCPVIFRQTERMQRSVRQSLGRYAWSSQHHISEPVRAQEKKPKQNGAHILKYYPLYCTHYRQCHPDYTDICHFNIALISIIPLSMCSFVLLCLVQSLEYVLLILTYRSTLLLICNMQPIGGKKNTIGHCRLIIQFIMCMLVNVWQGVLSGYFLDKHEVCR